MNGNIEKMQSLTGRIKALAIDTTLTKKGMCAEAKAVGEALATKVNITDIVNDLTSVASDKPLSANQGRILKKQIDEIDPHYAENVIYDDTNVKDAIDKLSKAENIAYDEEKSVKGAIDELNTNVEDVQTKLKYYDYLDIKDKISLSSNCHSLISAYVKNGFVHIKGVINESAVLGQTTWLFVINDTKYKPSETMYGNIIYRSSADLNKVLDVRIGSDGTCYVWLLNDLASHTYFSLMYPI